MNEVINFWDNNLVQRHIVNELNWLFEFLEEKKIKEVSYIDIGCNVGKFYDVISKKYNIKKCIMIEPSKELFEYINQKFKDNKNVTLFNFAISDENGQFNFVDSAKIHLEQYKCDSTNESINLGLSKIDKKNKGNTLCYSMEYFLEHFNTIPVTDITFIKIDTENTDLNIIKSMTNFFIENKINPFILFENNFHNDLSEEEAKGIILNFCNSCNYEFVNLSSPGDNFIKPKQI